MQQALCRVEELEVSYKRPPVFGPVSTCCTISQWRDTQCQLLGCQFGKRGDVYVCTCMGTDQHVERFKRTIHFMRTIVRIFSVYASRECTSGLRNSHGAICICATADAMHARALERCHDDDPRDQRFEWKNVAVALLFCAVHSFSVLQICNLCTIPSLQYSGTKNELAPTRPTSEPTRRYSASATFWAVKFGQHAMR